MRAHFNNAVTLTLSPTKRKGLSRFPGGKSEILRCAQNDNNGEVA
jgi:hypothetical protein